jgi:hypothetical protein
MTNLNKITEHGKTCDTFTPEQVDMLMEYQRNPEQYHLCPQVVQMIKALLRADSLYKFDEGLKGLTFSN